MNSVPANAQWYHSITAWVGPLFFRKRCTPHTTYSYNIFTHHIKKKTQWKSVIGVTGLETVQLSRKGGLYI